MKKVNVKSLLEQQNQLQDREEIRKIVRQQLMRSLNGGSFWDSVMSVVKPVASVVKNVTSFIPHPGAQAASQVLGALGAGHAGGRRKPKQARKPNARMTKRNEMVKALMKDQGMTLPEASRYIREHNLA